MVSRVKTIIQISTQTSIAPTNTFKTVFSSAPLLLKFANLILEISSLILTWHGWQNKTSYYIQVSHKQTTSTSKKASSSTSKYTQLQLLAYCLT